MGSHEAWMAHGNDGEPALVAPSLQVMIDDEDLKPVLVVNVKEEDIEKYKEIPAGGVVLEGGLGGKDAEPKQKAKALSYNWTDDAILLLLRCVDAKKFHLYMSTPKDERPQIPSSSFPPNSNKKQNTGNYWALVFWPYLRTHSLFQAESLNAVKAMTKYQALMRGCKDTMANQQVNTSGMDARPYDDLLLKLAKGQADSGASKSAKAEAHNQAMANSEVRMSLSDQPGYGPGGLLLSPTPSTTSSSSTTSTK
jgi:hypothetical protein